MRYNNTIQYSLGDDYERTKIMHPILILAVTAFIMLLCYGFFCHAQIRAKQYLFSNVYAIRIL